MSSGTKGGSFCCMLSRSAFSLLKGSSSSFTGFACAFTEMIGFSKHVTMVAFSFRADKSNFRAFNTVTYVVADHDQDDRVWT